MRSLTLLSAALAVATSCKTASPAAGDAASLKDDGAPQAPSSLEWLDGQSVTVDLGNKAAFDEKLRAIDAATKSIQLAVFSFRFDDSGAVLAERLLKKAEAGVDVSVIVDAMASLKWRAWWKMLAATSAEAAQQGHGKPIQIMYFRPIPDDVWADLASWGFTDRAALEAAASDLDVEKITGLVKGNTRLGDKPAMKLLIGTLLPTKSAKVDMVGPLRDAANGDLPADVAFDVFTDGLFRGAQAAGMTFRPKAWVSLSKRLQHRLLVVDDRLVVGGARTVSDRHNMEVDFSLKEESDDLVSFASADWTVDGAALAAKAKATFNDYWTCADNMPACTAKIPMLRETPKADPALRQQLAEQAKRFETAIQSYQPTAKVLHAGRMTAQGARVAYVENRMFPQRKGFEKLAFGEELGAYHRAWEFFIAAARPGEDVILHNAYVLLPPGLQLALMRAIGNGAKVKIVTNGPDSDKTELDVALNAQYAALFTLAEKLRKEKSLPELPFKLFRYQTRESLHSKVAVIGNVVLVGSANADPRSKILDTQNGLVIDSAQLAGEYKSWLSELETKQRAGKAVMRELTLREALEIVPPYEKVKASPNDYRSDQQFDAYAAHLFQVAMDPGTDRPKAALVGGLLNTLFLNL